MGKDKKPADVSPVSQESTRPALKLISGSGEHAPSTKRSADSNGERKGKSAFADMMSRFCDALDEQIESIKLQ